ncbi:ScyD/ScyE family protein [Nocardioides sp. KR10-350]|uniref:ScyD/ScyE family protein n=1 Tax=Nocardioides cheoyonin TaxID=3156615 RepID=UPI0032B61F5A
MSRFHRLVASAAVLALAGAGIAATSPGAEAQKAGAHAKAKAKAHKPKAHKKVVKNAFKKRYAKPWVVAKGLFTPLTTAVANDGTAYVTSNFGGQLLRIRPGKAPTVVYTAPEQGVEVGGVSVSGFSVRFTLTYSDPTTGEPSDTQLMQLLPGGRARMIADIYAYESSANPDQVNTYGFTTTVDPACLAKWPTADFGPASYTGMVDSHAYGTAQVGGSTYIADAGANAILKVSPFGRVSTVAVLPPIPHTLTADEATNLGLDPCFVGLTFNFEPVPTDVELGRFGKLYVSSLPGGPEGPVLGPRGSIFAVNAFTHTSKQIVTGLLGATGVAVAPNGTLYATEMFGGKIDRIFVRPWGAKITTLAKADTPAAVEWTPWGVVATTDALTGTEEENPTPINGKLIKYGF